MDSVHGSWTSARVADPRVHCGLPPRGRRQGSPELGLAAALGHGGSLRGWRWNGPNATRPGDHSPEPGRR
jgi:hypothetical protein